MLIYKLRVVVLLACKAAGPTVRIPDRTVCWDMNTGLDILVGLSIFLDSNFGLQVDFNIFINTSKSLITISRFGNVVDNVEGFAANGVEDVGVGGPGCGSSDCICVITNFNQLLCCSWR